MVYGDMNNTLGINITPESVGPFDTAYWLRLERVVLIDDIATAEDASELLDELYGTSICDDEYELPACGGSPLPIKQEDSPEDAVPLDDLNPAEESDETEETGDENDPTQEEIVEVASEVLNIDSCGTDTENFLVEVKVIRSHPTLPYKLQIDGGTLKKTTVVEETINLNTPVEKSTNYQLEWPIAEGKQISFKWSGGVVNHDNPGSVPAINYNDGYLTWTDDITGVLFISTPTIYDVLEIEVPRGSQESSDAINSFGFIDATEWLFDIERYIAPETSGQCLILAFYQYEVTELTVTEEELQRELDQMGMVCPTGFGRVSNKLTSPDAYCYDLLTALPLCRCSGELFGELQDPVEVEVSCKEGTEKGRHLYQTRSQVTYVDCNETTGEVNNPTYYEKICCTTPPWPLPHCKEVTVNNTGGKSMSNEDVAYWTAQHDNVEFYPVSPENGDCGTIIYTQRVKNKNCCDVAVPLVYDTENSVEVIADFSSGLVFVFGGLEVLNVSVRGDGFWLDANHSLRDVTVLNTNGPIYATAIRVFTENSCGNASIVISDGCSSINNSIRSTEGGWYILDSYDPYDPEVSWIGLRRTDHPWVQGELISFDIGGFRYSSYSRGATNNFYPAWAVTPNPPMHSNGAAFFVPQSVTGWSGGGQGGCSATEHYCPDGAGTIMAEFWKTVPNPPNATGTFRFWPTTITKQEWRC